MNIIAKLQIDKLIKLNQCNMEDLGAVSALASKLGMKALLTSLYVDSQEYLVYIRKHKKRS